VIYGYARVSTDAQDLTSQVAQPKAAGCETIFRKKMTGIHAERPQLKKLMAKLDAGDVVTVTRIDRLARSTFDLFAIVKQIVDAGGQFRSLADPWADTATSTRVLDDRRAGRTGGRRARSDSHADGGRPEPGEGARAAHGPSPEINPAAGRRSTAAAGRGRDAQGTCQELQRRPGDDFEVGAMSGSASDNVKFVQLANPQAWMLAADDLHEQALNIYKRKGQTRLTQVDHQDKVVSTRDGINKTAFLLGGFALENAIKAFLVYENPAWISNGTIAKALRSHKLTTLRSKSKMIPLHEEEQFVLEQFESGLESWARYPCGLTLAETPHEVMLQPDLWDGYIRLMGSYGSALCDLLSREWRGPHGFFGHYQISGQFLGGHFP
jgi:hypothetical protein